VDVPCFDVLARYRGCPMFYLPCFTVLAGSDDVDGVAFGRGLGHRVILSRDCILIQPIRHCMLALHDRTSRAGRKFRDRLVCYLGFR
jgi:hypothetical protein